LLSSWIKRPKRDSNQVPSLRTCACHNGVEVAEADSPHILWNLKVHYHVHKSPHITAKSNKIIKSVRIITTKLIIFKIKLIRIDK